MNRILFPAAVFALALTVLASAGACDPVRVAVSIPPQKYFVERIGGGNVTVTVLSPPGSDPHTYEPKPRQITALANADVYFGVGVTFENVWLDRFRAVNPRMRVVATDDGIEKIPMAAHGGHGEGHEGHEHDDDSHDDHGDHDDHDGDGSLSDPHIWLSPSLVRRQAEAVYRVLAEIDPPNAERYAEGFKSLTAEIDRLDEDLRALLKPSRGRNVFMVFHPAWGYFANEYGLVQEPVETGGKEPGPADLARLISLARERGIRAIFVQPQMSRRSAQTVADAIGGTVITADPLAEDWAENLRRVASAMSGVLR